MRTLIKGGRVISPSDRMDSAVNILTEDGKIKMLCMDEPDADEVIDARGLTVTPGFIDIHMHEDPVVNGKIQNDIFNCMLRMGVTTVLGGNCGSNACNPAEYLDIAERSGAPVNVAMLAGEGWFRYNAGQKDRYAPVSREQLDYMVSGINAALSAGCMGVSYGVRYYPGITQEEINRTAACCAGNRGFIAAHVRDDAANIFSAVDEICDAGREFGVPVQISHIGSMAGFGQMQDVLRMLDMYRANGLDVMLDCYPYTAFSTGLGETTYDDGWLERYNCNYNVLEFCEGEYRGKRATAESFAKLRKEQPDMLTVCHVMKESDIDIALAHPAVITASDGILNDGQGHPRAAGCFPRVYAEYVRRGKLSLNDAVSKMTEMPAKRMGLKNKGTLHAGADADIVIFNSETICDRATFESPTLPPDGIQRVLIAGTTAVINNVIVNDRLGTAIRRS